MNRILGRRTVRFFERMRFVLSALSPLETFGTGTPSRINVTRALRVPLRAGNGRVWRYPMHFFGGRLLAERQPACQSGRAVSPKQPHGGSATLSGGLCALCPLCGRRARRRDRPTRCCLSPRCDDYLCAALHTSLRASSTQRTTEAIAAHMSHCPIVSGTVLKAVFRMGTCTTAI